MAGVMDRHARRSSPLIVLLASLLATTSGVPRARASGESGGGSSSSSGDSSNSKGSNFSNGSNDSSNSSKGTSDNSQASSKDSNNSTQNSPQNSSDYTTRHSSDWSTKSRDGHIFSIVLLVVSIGAVAVGVGLTVAKDARRASRQEAERELAAFMRRQHPLLTHDVATGRGAVLAAWSHDLGLDARERALLARALDGSREQGALLEALDGKIDEARARRFAGAFFTVTARALGPARTKALVERAARATGPV